MIELENSANETKNLHNATIYHYDKEARSISKQITDAISWHDIGDHWIRF